MRVQRGGQNVYHIGFEGTLTVTQGMSYGILGVTDTFTDANGTNLTAHVPDLAPAGAAWAICAGAPASGTIQGNKANIVDYSYNWCGYSIESGLADCTVKVSLYPNWVNPCGGGLFLRDDGTDHLTAGISRASNTCYLLDTNGATLDSDTLARNPSDQINVTATLLGSSITVLFENVTASTSVTLTGTSTNNQAATKHGISMMVQWGEGSNDYLDDFSVTA